MAILIDAKPLPMTGDMVLATLGGGKNQTRRLGNIGSINLDPNNWRFVGWAEGSEDVIFEHVLATRLISGVPVPIRQRVKAPFKIGEVRWIRESWRTLKKFDPKNSTEIAEECMEAGWKQPWCPIQYEADKVRDNWIDTDGDVLGRLRVARFMPRYLARLYIQIDSIRVERLQAITTEDALREGLRLTAANFIHGPEWLYWDYLEKKYRWASPINSFSTLWDSINGKTKCITWKDNPWVFVVGYHRFYLPEQT